MAGKIKIPVTVIVFLILLLAAASFGGWAFLNFQAEKTLNVTLQVNLDKLKQENKRIEVRFQEANKKADSLSQDIEKERAAKQDLLDQVGKFRQQLDRQKEEITILEKLLGSSQTEVNDLTVKLNKLNFKDKELEGKLKASPEIGKKADSLPQDVEKERAAKQDFLNQVNQLRQSLEKQKEEVAILEKVLGASQNEVNDLNVKLNKLNFKNKELEAKLKANSGTDNKIELGKIVVNP